MIKDYFQNFFKKKVHPQQKYLSVCSIFKNEARYLQEWIEFHKLVGVQRFYLYNNNSTDNYEEVLRPYVEKGIVILTMWPIEQGQRQAYTDCIRRFRNDSYWMAFIDIDEFLFGTKENNLHTILRNYETYPGIQVNWLVFGSSGHVTRPPGLVLENYLWRNFPRAISKTIVKMSQVDHYLTAHAFRFHGGLLPVSENFETLRQAKDNKWGSHTETPSVDVLRINHYLWKSREDSRIRITLGRACHTNHDPRKNEKMDKNDIQDLTIQRFIHKLKKNMGVI